MSTTRYCRLFKATTAFTSAFTDAGAAFASLLSGGNRVRHWQSAQRLWPDMRRLQLPLDDCCRLVLPYNVEHSIEQIPNHANDPHRMGAKSTTTTSNNPSTPTPNVKPSIKRNNIYSSDYSPVAVAKFKVEINKANLSDIVQLTFMSDPNISYNRLDQGIFKVKTLHILIKEVKFDKKTHKKSEHNRRYN